jgi:orotate phosphoribosyltransferase
MNPSNIDIKTEKLREIIKKEGVVTENQQKIITHRGSESNWLLDLRNIFLRPDSLDLITDIFWHIFEKEYPFQVGGQEIAAIPLVSAIILKSQLIGKPVNGFIIRKSRKPTGLQKLIEGKINDEKIILVDDLINSGSTILRQVKVIESIGKRVDSTFAFINFRGERNLKLLKNQDIKLYSLFSLQDLGLSLKEKKGPPEQNFEVVWHFQSPEPNYYYLVPKSTPVIDGKNIYLGSDSGNFWALSQDNGSVAWKFKVGYHVRGKNIFSSPAIYNNIIYFGSYDGNVYALDKNSGKPEWKFGEADWIGSSPVVAPDLGLLFIGLEFGWFKIKGGIAALDLKTGKKIWSYYEISEYVHCSPAYCPEKKVVVIGGNDRTVYMFDAKNGKLKWKFKTEGEIKASFDFDVVRNLVLFGSFDGNLYALDIDSGDIRGKFETKDRIYSTPKVHEDNVYFTSTDKNIYSVNLETGKLSWNFAAGGRFFASPEIIDGKIIAGATDGKLYEINIKTGECDSFFQATERITNKIAYNPRTKRYFLPTYANEIYCLEK